MRFWVALFAISIALSSNQHAFQLNEPIPAASKVQWEKISSDVSACFMDESGGDALCFVIDRGDHNDPLLLSLDSAGSSLPAFFSECEKLLEQVDKEKSQKKICIAVNGTSLQGEVKEWLSKIASLRSKNEPASVAIFGQPPVRIVREKVDEASQLVLSYNFNLPSLKTFREVRKLWVMKLIQQMTVQRMANEGILPMQSTASRELLLPATNLRIAFPYDENNWQKSLQVGLQKIKEIAEIGFTNDELQAAKRECLLSAQELQKEFCPGENAARAAFHAQSYVRGLGQLSYGTFLDSAVSLLDSITPVDIAIVMHECFSKEQRTLTYLAPQQVESSWITQAQQIVDSVEKGENQRVALLLQTEMESPENLFFQLPLHEHEKVLIHKIVDTMARDNVIKLGLKRKTMEKKGKKIRHVHPLRFLGHVFADPHLKHCMREISRSSFKWNGFIDGMRDRIEEEAARGGLLPHVHAFAQHVHCDEERARRYIEKHDWEKLVRLLLE